MNQCLHELLTKPRTCEGIRRLNAWEPHEQSEFIELLYKHFRKCLHYDGSHGVMQEQGRQDAGRREGRCCEYTFSQHAELATYDR